MKEIEGIVEEVYIPLAGKLDSMFSNKIGFKVRTEHEIIQLEEDQNDYNAEILKGDKVIIRKQIISNKLFVDIEKLDGEWYE